MSVSSHSFTVKNSNYIEALGYMCTEQMKIPLQSPFEKEHIIVMNSGMKSYLQQFIAHQNGICSNVSFDQLWSFVWNIYKKITPDSGDDNYFEHDYIIWTLYQMLYLEHCADLDESLATVKNYIKDDTDGTKTYELCVAIADTYDQYLMYRNDWILMWDAIAQHSGDQDKLISEWQKSVSHTRNSDERQLKKNQALGNVLKDNSWQPKLWILLFSRLTLNQSEILPSRYDRAMVIEEVCARLNSLDAKSAEDFNLPERVFIFGVSSLQPQIIRFLRSLSKHVDVNVMLLNPCREYWGDIDNEWITRFKEFKKSLAAIRQSLVTREVSQELTGEALDRFKSMPVSDFKGDLIPLHGQELSTTEECYSEEGELVEGNSLLLSLGKQGRDNLSLMLDSNPGADMSSIKSNQLLYTAFTAMPFNRKIAEMNSSASETIDPCFDNLFIDPLTAGGDTVLHRIQSQLLTLEQPSARIEIKPEDTSLEIHSCHTQRREVEVLRDALLLKFKESIGKDGLPALKPRDCLVMMPQIEKYAPYIEAVFGSVPEDDKTYIPYALSDRSSKDSSEIADAVLKLLDIGVRRITLSMIVDLLTVPAIARRYHLSADDVDNISLWCQEANIHWGLNAKDSVKETRVDSVPWTFEQGLFRMLKGYLIGDTEELLPVYTQIEGADAKTLGSFYSFIEDLEKLRDEFVLPEELQQDGQSGAEVSLNFAQWGETLEKSIFGRFFYDRESPDLNQDPTYRECQDIKQICDDVSLVVNNLKEDSKKAGLDTPELKIALPVFRSMLSRKLALSNESDSFMGGRVIFCSMIPMRAIPFKHIFILGLDDVSFPRQDKVPAFNLVGLKGLFRRGDRSRSIDDRYCFMEALLSARESIYLSYIGKSPIDNSDKNPSTVLEDLFDYICDVFTVQGAGVGESSQEKVQQDIIEALKARLIKQETLASYNPLNYLKEEGTRSAFKQTPSFDINSFVPSLYRDNLTLKHSLLPERRYLGDNGIDYFKVETSDPVLLDVNTMKGWLIDPARNFLKNCLEISFYSSDDLIASDDEPFGISDFEKNQVLNELGGRSSLSADSYLKSSSQSGRLPYGVLSSSLKQQLESSNLLIEKAVQECLNGRQVQSVRYEKNFTVSLTDYADILSEPSLKGRTVNISFSGLTEYPNLQIDYYALGETTARFNFTVILQSFALHYAGVPSLVQAIDKDGKVRMCDVARIGSSSEIDSYFEKLLALCIIGMLRPMPVTSKMVTVVGNHKYQDKFFEYSKECCYVFGSFENVPEILKKFVRAGIDDDDENCNVQGILLLYSLLRDTCFAESPDSKKKPDETKAGKKSSRKKD